jgi:hypothetical protein
MRGERVWRGRPRPRKAAIMAEIARLDQAVGQMV